ncbi:MAG: DUF2760 domain-containing protein [Deltaproteobacteria bacterium]|nr:DUF2760 domain-containing protein [Deltaproteobacteria bacterium]
MAASSRGSGTIVSALLLLALAAADAFVLHRLSLPGQAALLTTAGETLASSGPGAALRQLMDAGLLAWLAIPVAGPLLIAVVALLTGRSRVVAAPAADAAAETDELVEPAGAVASPDVALRLLATLQEEARLIDFVREDIDGYADAEVGSAARGIHAALRKALDDRLVVEPILTGEDGDSVEVPVDFEPALVRVTGKLAGGPPYSGVLRHGGWRVREVRLPAPSPGSDARILLPAEVEVGVE